MLRVKTEGESLTIYIDDRAVIAHTPFEPFIRAGKGKWEVHGSEAHDRLAERSPLTKASYEAQRSVIRFSGGDFSLSFHIAEKDGNLVLSPQRSTTGLSRVQLSFPASPDEAVFGGGAQYGSLNMRGKRIPLWVREYRVEERLRPQPALSVKHEGAYPTAFPIPLFFTSNWVWHYFDTISPAVFDFRPSKVYRVELWDLPSGIVIGKAENPLDLMRRATRFTGRQPVLPQWVLEGTCVEIQGGSPSIIKTLQNIKESGATVTSLWLKDWTGYIDSPSGRKPFYDWSWNREIYPSLDKVIPELTSKGIRSLAYINPHLSIEGRLFAEASMREYLVKKPQGGNYICDMGGFMAGMLDLTNPSACAWFKEIVKQNILAMGFCGYDADMGDYLPSDAVLYSGEHPVKVHNRWAVMWSSLNRELIREAGRTSDTIFYSRSGWAGSGSQVMLATTGDHLTGWSKEHGFPSALAASLNFSLSGVGISHSYSGGNISFISKRTKELFMRWLDYSALTPVMRVAVGGEGSWQFNSDKETLEHFARMSRVHTALSGYIRQCVRENANDGHPVMRPMFMAYPGDGALYKMNTQYMLGTELLVAPVLIQRQRSRKVYLPEGHWSALWSGKHFMGGEHAFSTPIGSPPVFYRSDSKYADSFALVTKNI
ncbi:MAG: alpha-glucosidase [Oscillospiraceae bacterium]|jgi:alpha-glucosidase|nr:alpha-glucosidase [Oscillospiraceae bacterium]